MRKKILVVLVAVFLVFGAFNASAQMRLDVDIPWVLTAGANLNMFTGGGSGAPSLDLSQFHLILPHVDLAYQFGNGIFTGGVGLRNYTILFEFFSYPMGYVELNFKPLVIRAEMGGFAFLLWGVYNYLFVSADSLKIWLPDVSVAFAFTDWFRLGAGATLIVPFGDFNNFGYILYIDARFNFLFGGKK